jgi:glucose dehydrogenase
MFLHSPFPNKVFAIDLETQKIKWKYEPKQDPAVIPQMCCDTVNRGLAYAEGKVFLQQADSTLVALDAKSGKVIWSVKNGDPKLGAVNTNAPHVFKDKVITGISGGEWGVRGFLAAYDINTGKQVWKGYSVGPDAEMLIDPEKTTTWTDGKMAPVGKDVAEDLAGRPVEDRWRHHLGLVQLRQGQECWCSTARQPLHLEPGRSVRATTSGRCPSGRVTSIPARSTGSTR